ncbi:HAD family hydrolase [Parasulfuritortus cantonensis]|uniref:HAD family hydrolase n=1 Tax=Parasulfuritortus cantonensis TaxID=2528202 RepID=UPI0019809E96|nr:HAD family hydrolase [Parasulfuritortus cantonensis]
MSGRVLIATDLDRTLIPNGAAPESPGARALFARVAARPDVVLAYVTGRHRALVEAAIAEYGLPVPDYLIGDVGSTVYRVEGAIGGRSRTGRCLSRATGKAGRRATWRRPWPDWPACACRRRPSRTATS